MTKREVQIPFAGFYGSKWADMIDRAIEQTAEHDHEQQTSEYADEEYRVRDPRLVLDASAYHDAIFDACGYRDANLGIAKDYADCFNTYMSDALGFPLNLTYSIMTSPRFYNFETDRIFCNISDETARALFKFSKDRDDHASFKELIKERHTSRSGFISSYPTDLSHWFADDAPDFYDHNELCTLLLACMKAAGVDEDEAEWAIFEGMADHDYEYADAAVDWKKYREKIQEARDELQRELEEQGEVFDATLSPYYRCPETPDMFSSI
jgi:hypothetical protein